MDLHGGPISVVGEGMISGTLSIITVHTEFFRPVSAHRNVIPVAGQIHSLAGSDAEENRKGNAERQRIVLMVGVWVSEGLNRLLDRVLSRDG
jgi:hypothetical protein